ncbi:threonine synthase [Candidatus Peregrinibacteria bacterium]|nr:threonine synthase [Candidatus Peregrinibacteria bacterium]
MLKNHFYTLVCLNCGKSFEENQTTTRCLKCAGPLDVKYDKLYIKSRLNQYSLEKSPICGLKYLDFYPIRDLSHVVSLKEGNTPLQHAKILGKKMGLKKLYVKNEGHNPTGVFKDRGSLVELTKALELKATAICCASTGNMAASVSAYASVAGLPCYVFVPEGTPIGKLAQTLSYGARILQVRGTYADCVKLSEEAAKKHHFYLAGDYVFRGEGQKSLAYEVIEQLLWNVPDYVIVPMGCGTNISAIWKGFKEFYEFGFIKRLPKMIGVQPQNVPTIVEAFRKKKKEAIKVKRPQTVASAVGIGEPQDDIKALQSLHESKGYAYCASEEEILEAQQELSRSEALFVEPSSAIPIAVLRKLLKEGVIKKDSTVICVATGNGLKDPKSAVSILPDPPVIEPENEEVERYIKFKLYSIRASRVQAKEKELWTKMPKETEIKNIIKKEFNLSLDDDYLTSVLQEIRSFFEKTPKMKKADLQYILENSLKQVTIKSKILEIIDFEVTDSKHSRPKAMVKIKFSNDIIEEKAEGDGPVDAIINAIKKAIKSKDKLKCVLTDYSVEIDTAGTDAVVEVRMGLKDIKNNQVTGMATSPDVIVASINAFEKGYNILYQKSGL